jgi:hypothetical protein
MNKCADNSEKREQEWETEWENTTAGTEEKVVGREERENKTLASLTYF